MDMRRGRRCEGEGAKEKVLSMYHVVRIHFMIDKPRDNVMKSPHLSSLRDTC